MTEGDRTRIAARLPRWTWVAAALALLAAACVLLVQKIETFDSYCGSVLYDTNMSAPCDGEMSWRRIVVGILFVAGTAILGAALIVGRTGQTRRYSVATAVGVAVFFVGLVMATNRFLQPAEEWCGSVVNRHRTYERMHESMCDDHLRPHLLAGLAWTWVSLCGLAVAAWGAFNLRSHESRD